MAGIIESSCLNENGPDINKAKADTSIKELPAFVDY